MERPGPTAQSRMTAAQFIARTMQGYGITHVFFVESILRRVLIELEVLGVRRILAHSEKAAAYMADGYARASRRPAVCMAQSVGAANLAAGLQDPFLGLSPVIALTGRKPPIAQHRNAYQEIIHGPLFDSVTKFNASIDTADQLPTLLRQAFREATSGAPGPVHLDVMGFVGEILETAEGPFEVVVEAPFTRYPPFRPEPSSQDIQEAALLIKMAQQPVIVAGGGATASAAGPEIVELAEALLVPVATALNGKGTIRENHPLSVGAVGSYSRSCANRIVSEADLVMFIGSHTGDQVTNYWTIPGAATRVIQIDIDPRELGRNFRNVLPLLGDAKVTLQKLLGAIDPGERKGPWADRARRLVEEWRAEQQPLLLSEDLPIRPERLCMELNDLLPEDAILVADTGYASIWTGTLVELVHPGQRYIRAAGSLGWGLPAAIGAKCAAPNRPVVCVTGDGGAWYHMSELETARRCDIRTVTIINNNSCLRQGLDSINRAYGDRPGSREELYTFRNVNFARIAEEMGCLGIRVESPREIAGAIRKALDADLPAVVDVVTDPNCAPPKPWTPS